MIDINYLKYLLLAILTLFAYIWYRKFNNTNSQKIPGPYPFPIIGNIFQLGINPHIRCCEWANKYGNIFRYKIISLNIIMLNDLDSIKEAFNIPELCGRPNFEAINVLRGGKRGVLMAEGTHWNEQRRFTLRQLRDFGFGKHTMETIIMEEVNEFIEYCKSKVGEPLNLDERFNFAILNSIWFIVTGERFSHSNPLLNEMFIGFEKALNEINPIAMFWPSLTKIAPGLTGWRKYLTFVDFLRNTIERPIEEHWEKYKEEESEVPRDFIDSYIKEIKKTTNPNSSFYKEEGKKTLIGVVMDLFAAGSDTTTSTLSWAILYLTHYTEIQVKLQIEIDTVVGKSRRPALSDRPMMPYTEALILEVLRKSTIFPNGVMHAATKDVQFKGFKIKKGWGLVSNVYGVHHDEKIWGDPENFRPERFINEDGTCMKKVDNLLSFSSGKRACFGENLARDSLFLFIMGIYSTFNTIFAEGEKPTLNPKVTFTLKTHPYSVVLVNRY